MARAYSVDRVDLDGTRGPSREQGVSQELVDDGHRRTDHPEAG